MSAEWYFIDSASVYGAIFASANDFSEEKTRIKFWKEHFIGIGSTSACNDKNRCEKCQYFEYHLILGVYKTPVIFSQIYCKVCALSKFSILAFPLFLLSWDQCQSLPTLPICRLLHMGLPSLRTTNDFGYCPFWGKKCVRAFTFKPLSLRLKSFLCDLASISYQTIQLSWMIINLFILLESEQVLPFQQVLPFEVLTFSISGSDNLAHTTLLRGKCL